MKNAAKSRAAATKQIVNFHTKTFSENTNYIESLTGNSGYINGSYGADAAYLGVVNGRVKFMMGGVVGLVDFDEVQVLSLNDVESYSYYAGFK